MASELRPPQTPEVSHGLLLACTDWQVGVSHVGLFLSYVLPRQLRVVYQSKPTGHTLAETRT